MHVRPGPAARPVGRADGEAVAHGAAGRSGPLIRDPRATSGLVSPPGVFGDARLATRAKGKAVVEQTEAGVLAEIDALAALSLPAGTPGSPLEAGR